MTAYISIPWRRVVYVCARGGKRDGPVAAGGVPPVLRGPRRPTFRIRRKLADGRLSSAIFFFSFWKLSRNFATFQMNREDMCVFVYTLLWYVNLFYNKPYLKCVENCGS